MKHVQSNLGDLNLNVSLYSSGAIRIAWATSDKLSNLKLHNLFICSFFAQYSSPVRRLIPHLLGKLIQSLNFGPNAHEKNKNRSSCFFEAQGENGLAE